MGRGRKAGKVGNIVFATIGIESVCILMKNADAGDGGADKKESGQPSRSLLSCR